MERVERSEQRPGLLAVDNETTSSAVRVTVEGKTITYRMNVVQQPQRARACGQGAKSSADRRPVDPPPIVELKIFEGENAENDITFTMHANYFLYAELQHARVMAQGRLPQERTMPPVLTGTPVAGIAYLDRPSPAGYFIFPDLSVRHEGKYRLSFSLYEELKDLKDADKPEDGASPEVASEPYVAHRLEVKSEAFTVFSAKKFPGLTESTPLSRMVAEQGCRVRIRRDVRMRRREPKSGGKDWDEYEEETAQARARMSATPDPNMYGALPAMEPVPRPRSPSSASLQSSLSRRPSLQDLNQAYPSSQYGAQPHTPQSNGAYAPAPPFGSVAAPPLHQPMMQPPPPQYSSQAYAAPPPPMSAGSMSHYQPAPPPPAPYATPVRAYEPAKPEYRRPSVQYPTPAPPPVAYPTTPSAHSGYAASPMPQPAYPPHTDTYNARPAPLEPTYPPMRASGASTPLSNRRSYDLPPLNTTVPSSAKLEASSPVAGPPPGSYFSSYQTSESNKRSYGHVFSDKHQSQPLRHGARPTSYAATPESVNGGPFLSAADDGDDDATGELDLATLGMHYRRADGRRILRALPPQS